MARPLRKSPGLWGVGSEIRDLPLFQKYGDIPLIDQDQVVTVHRRPPAKIAADNAGKTYEEVNWPRLSPVYRAAHNRLRQQRGLHTIPPPVIDEYVPPPPSNAKIDPAEALREARGFNGTPFFARGGEGFTIEGSDVTDADLTRKARTPRVRLAERDLEPAGREGAADLL